MHSPPYRAAIYTRVSSEDQLNGHSLEAQERLVKQFCNFREWEVVKVYSERGRSGKNVLRPEFQTMLLDAEAGLFDVLVVHKLDRFSRSIIDVHTYIKKLDGLGISFVSATEPFDLTSPMGKAFLGILAIFAELYLDNLSAEITKGKKQRALKGYWNGQLSWGYTTPKRLQEMIVALNQSFKSGDLSEDEYARRADLLDDALARAITKSETAAVPDPFTASGVQMAYNEYSTGLYSDRDIAHLLNAAGYQISARLGSNRLRKDTVEDILQNRFYIGETSYGHRVPGQERQWIPGNHEPIIERDLFEQCQEVRKVRSTRFTRGRNKQKSPYLLDMLVCVECGTRLIGWKVRGVRKYYDQAANKERVCHQTPKYIDADEIEQKLIDFLSDLRFPSDWQERLLQRFSEQQDTTPVLKHRAAVEGRLMRLRELYIAGDIAKEHYEQRRLEFQNELNSFTTLNAKGLDLKRMAELMQSIGDLWALAQTEERKKLLQMVFRNIYIEGGEIKAVEPTELMWVLLDTVMFVEAGRTRTNPNFVLA